MASLRCLALLWCHWLVRSDRAQQELLSDVLAEDFRRSHRVEGSALQPSLLQREGEHGTGLKVAMTTATVRRHQNDTEASEKKEDKDEKKDEKKEDAKDEEKEKEGKEEEKGKDDKEPKHDEKDGHDENQEDSKEPEKDNDEKGEKKQEEEKTEEEAKDGKEHEQEKDGKAEEKEKESKEEGKDNEKDKDGKEDEKEDKKQKEEDDMLTTLRRDLGDMPESFDDNLGVPIPNVPEMPSTMFSKLKAELASNGPVETSIRETDEAGDETMKDAKEWRETEKELQQATEDLGKASHKAATDLREGTLKLQKGRSKAAQDIEKELEREEDHRND